MNIIIKAQLYAPGWFQRYGGTNPPIFTKEFTLEIPRQLLSLFCENARFTHDKVLLEIENRKGSHLTCSGNLRSISEFYFKELISRGWKLEVENARKEGLPNNKRNKALRKLLQEQREKTKRILDFQEGSGKVKRVVFCENQKA